MTMRSIALLLLSAACLSLSGCGSRAHEISGEAIAQAATIKDPVAAWRRITAAKEELYAFCGQGDAFRLCDGPRADLILGERIYLPVAAEAGNTVAVRALFERGDLEEAQNRLAPQLLKAAKDSKDPNILFAAAKILGDGQVIPRDTKQQTVYLAQAWLLGDIESAGLLATVLDELGDFPNAYLWSLRCTVGCQRRGGVGLRQLEQKLSRDQVLSIQEAATDKMRTRVDREVSTLTRNGNS